jgi:hypothetical protein
VDHPRVVAAINSVMAVWSYVEPVLTPLETKSLEKFSKKNQAEIDAKVPSNSFIKNLTWLREDIKSFDSNPGVGAGSSATVAFSEMLILQLNKVQAILSNPNTVSKETGSPGDFSAILEKIEGQLIALENASEGNESSEKARAAASDLFATLKEPDAKAMINSGLQISKDNVRAEIELFKSEIQGMQGLPCANGLSLK